MILDQTELSQDEVRIALNRGIPISGKVLFERIEMIGDGVVFYNTNNALIKLFLENSEQINDDYVLRNEFRGFFKYIEKVHDYTSTEISLKRANKFLNEIMSIFDCKIEIDKEDFPERFRHLVLE